MTKPISTRAHGIIDYTWAAAASSLASRVNGSTSTARLLRSAAATATASSLVTNYEAGAWPLVPMKGHLILDAMVCSALVAAPFFLPASERRHAAYPVLLGVVGLIAGLLTQTQSPREVDEEFGGMYGGSELSTIADQGRAEPGRGATAE
jgi:hypothetical protein